MGQPAPHVSLVIPVHHRSGDLAPQLKALGRFLLDAPVPAELVIVDDRGTMPGTTELLECFASRSGARLIRNDRNRGKGYSVARGMLAATGMYRVFTDADLAYPLSEVWKIVGALQRGSDIAIACRVHPQSEYVMSATYLRYIYTRHVISRAFNLFVRATLIPGVLDTQAGLKGFTAEAVGQVFSRVRIDGFGFDLESLFIARQLGLSIEQVPVRFQYNDEPTTVRFLRDGGHMAADLARIRWRGWTGEYRAPPNGAKAI